MENAVQVANNKENTRYKRYRVNPLLFLVVVIAAITIQYTILPDKYFYDRYTILSLMELNVGFRLQASYDITAFISRLINVFNLSTPFQWSIFYAAIMNPILYLMLRKKEIPTLPRLIWVYAAIGLLNIYTFVLSKDIFQYILYLIIYLIVSRDKIKETNKVLICVLLLLLWGIVFRIYFLLIAAFTLMMYILFKFFLLTKAKRMIVPAAIAGVFITLIVMSLIVPEEYMTVITVHSSINVNRENSPDALTAIISLIPNNDNNLFLFMLNYSINIIRMSLPIELLFNFQIHYILFFLFQVMLVYLVFLSLRNTLRGASSTATVLALCLYFGYLLGSALFEPDFGSWIRHEISLFPVLVLFILTKSKKSIQYDSYTLKEQKYLKVT